MNGIEKSLIIHITCGGEDALKARLHENPLFTLHYQCHCADDGWESTVNKDHVKVSTRYYYSGSTRSLHYDISLTRLIAHQDVYSMIRHLQEVGTGFTYKIKIQPKGKGNHHFD